MLTKDKVEFLKICTDNVKKKIFYNNNGVSLIFDKSDLVGYVKNCDLLKTCLELKCGVYRINKAGDVVHCKILDILHMQNLYAKKEKYSELKEDFLYG